MRSKFISIIAVLLLLISCSPQRKMSRMVDGMPIEKGNWESFCDTTRAFKSLYYSKISAKLMLGEDQYRAKLSLYYLPDSVFFVSAVNSGFEIVRIGVFEDSIVYINRIDKMVYIVENSKVGFPAPVYFKDIEYLINKQLICKEKNIDVVGDTSIIVNRSVKDVVKEIEYSARDLALIRFVFFQKKTGEYIVGEQTKTNSILIYSNYMVGHFMLEGNEGEIEYDKEIQVDLSINRRKYGVVYL